MKVGQQKISDFYKSKTVLLTGNRGFIGSSLQRKMQGFGCNIISFKGDVSTKNDWLNQLEGVDLVFHLAAIEYNSTKDPYKDLQVNALSILNLLEICKKHGFKPEIVFASSSNVFGKSKKLPVLESDKETPFSVWSAHKLLAENYLKIYHEATDLKSVSLRLSNVYGPADSIRLMQRMALNKMILMAIKEGRLELYNNYNCIRDWIYIDDVVDAFLLSGMISEKKADTFLIGTNNSPTIKLVAETIKELVMKIESKEVDIRYRKDITLPPMAMRNYSPDCSLFKEETGWTPKVDLEPGITLTMERFLNEL